MEGLRAWLQRTVFPPIGSTFKCQRKLFRSGRIGTGLHGMCLSRWPNLRAEKRTGDDSYADRLVSALWPTSITLSEFIRFADETGACGRERDPPGLLVAIARTGPRRAEKR